MSDEKILSKEIIDVEEKTMYEFSLIAWHYGEFTSKGMVSMSNSMTLRIKNW